jgi:hypothetical protein
LLIFNLEPRVFELLNEKLCKGSSGILDSRYSIRAGGL